ncbi:MAG: PID-CTERM protein-sorting domain-containing protein [Flavobacteriales bacterium]
MKYTTRRFLALLLIAAPMIGALMAQPGPGGGPPCWPPPCIPIDGGLSLLIGAGALLGGRKALQARRARKSAL